MSSPPATPTSDIEVVRWPGMLLVGGAGRNSGKTKLSCLLIEHFCGRVPLVGLKVTAIREGDAGCPRGNDDCGVCTSLEGPYEITEEDGYPPGKDTSLMLAAGAPRVLWLRVMRQQLVQGVAAVVERIGTDTICICESNSVRNAIEPGVFVITKNRATKAFKRTAREVRPLANKVIEFDGERHDTGLEAFELHDGRWRMRAP